MKRKVLLSIFSLVLCCNLFAQQFPVNVIPRVKAPAPVNFYNYADDSALEGPITVQIFLNDLTVSSRQIRLKTYFEGGNINFSSKDFVIGAQDLFIEGGIPLTLTNAELAPYFRFENIQGIGQSVYAQSIPEGTYNFCFEVYDFLSGAKLSDKKCAPVFIFKNEPPILNLPFNGKNIQPSDFENIVFQWTPRHINVSNVEYDFSIVEIWDNNVDPQTAFLSQAPIYEETLRTTTLLYGPDKPLLLSGRKYAWRVRARALQGLEEVGLFKNEGYSEIFWFSRTAPCQIPEGISGEPKGTSKINIYWDQDPTLHSEYIIAYREANNSDANWFTKKTNSAWATIWDLKPGTAYEFKVKGKCSFQYSEYSELQYVTTDVIQNEDANYNCGIVPDEIAISNRDPHPGLNIGDQISAGDFKITITEIQSQSNGILSGKGFVAIPYLQFAKFGVTFTNILVNSDAQLAEGEIVTLYDPEFGEGASMTVDVDINISEGINGDSGELDDTVEVDFVVDTVEIDGNGAIVVTGTNGETAVIPGDDDVNIVSANGDVWSVGEDGTITKQEGADGGAVTDDTTNGLDGNGNVTSITAKGIKIEFEPSGFYHFDALPENTSATFEKEYKILDTESGKYRVPYKAISDNNGEDFINAKVTITDTSIIKDSIVFKTKDGAKVPVEWSGDIAKLKLKRKFDYVDEEIFAVVKSKDNGKYDVAGSLVTAHLASEQLDPINVTLVPVGIDGVSDLVKNGVKEIYAKAGVRLNIQDVKSISPEEIYGWDKDNNGRLSVGDSNILSHYTNEQKVLNNYIRQQSYYNNKTYYVFVTNIPITKSEVEGFMPLKRQFGFVFTASANNELKQTRTMAHELGHGIFGLKHTWDEYQFPQGATDHLMDYGSGTTLNHLDWKKIHAPGIKIYWFQGDEDGEFSGSYVLTPNYQFVFINNSSTLYVHDKKLTVTGTLPGFTVYGKKESDIPIKYKWSSSDGKYVNINDSNDFHAAIPKSMLPADSKLRFMYNLHLGCGQKGTILLDYKVAYKDLRLKDFNQFSSDDKAKLINATISKYSSDTEKSQPVACIKNDAQDNGSKWVEIPLDCNSPDILDLVKNDVEAVNLLVDETNIENIVKKVNDIKYKCVFENVNVDVKLKLIEKLAKGTIKEQQERALLKLIIYVRKSDATKLFATLKKDDNFNNVFKEIQNANWINLFGDKDNQDRLLKVLSYKLKGLTEDSDKWFIINSLIKTKYDDISDSNKKEFIYTMLMSTKEYDENQDKLMGATELFTEMLISDCEDLKDYKIVLDIALSRLEHQEVFSTFTQGNKIQVKIPGVILDTHCTVSVPTVGMDWSWVKPNNFSLNCGGSSRGFFYTDSTHNIASGDKFDRVNDVFAWAKYYWENRDAMSPLFEDNIDEFLKIFKKEFESYLNTIDQSNATFWDDVNINCSTISNIFNHISVYENSKSLRSVSNNKKISVLKTYFDCSSINAKTIGFQSVDKSILKLLSSFAKEDTTPLIAMEGIGMEKIYNRLSDKESFKTLAKVLMWMGGQAYSTNNYKDIDITQLIDSKGNVRNLNQVLALESDMFKFQNFGAKLEGNNFKVSINGEEKSIPYNQMVVVHASGSFKFLDQNIKEGAVLVMPLVQAYAMSKSNDRIVAEKTAWTAVDVVLLFVGVGEIKILFTAGNYVRKAIVASSLIGDTAGILGNVLNESALSPEQRFNLQMLAILSSLPQLSTSIKGIDNMVKSIDDRINTISNIKQKENLQSYFGQVKSKLPAVSSVEEFIQLLKNKGLFKKYEELGEPLQKIFKNDFMNSPENVFDALKKDSAFNSWLNYRKSKPNAILCN